MGACQPMRGGGVAVLGLAAPLHSLQSVDSDPSTMAIKSSQFFLTGTSKQFEFALDKYQEALQAKADSKNSKAEVLLRLDKW